MSKARTWSSPLLAQSEGNLFQKYTQQLCCYISHIPSGSRAWYLERMASYLICILYVVWNRVLETEENKKGLPNQQISVKLILGTCKGSLFWWGANKDDSASYIMIWNGKVRVPLFLKSSKKWTDDQILFHENHAQRINNFENVIAASPVTALMVNVMMCENYGTSKQNCKEGILKLSHCSWLR